MAKCQGCGVDGISQKYCRVCGEFDRQTRANVDIARKRRRQRGKRNPPWSKREPLSELLKRGDEKAVQKRLDDFADDFADVLMEEWT